VQPDIAFKDLGLVVIDEEQRFGVQHKEKFKLLRQLVDVLTLSATPIPRTLYLALTGARDLSTIETPPQDRLPVETIVCPYDERVIRDAIQRELSRDGQVFYLHKPRSRHRRCGEEPPRAGAEGPHRRRARPDDADDLEEVMTQFVNGDADVLLSTTIIESGIDIPNANTIIIDRADRFGLSDLYQLRGRVGPLQTPGLRLPRHSAPRPHADRRAQAHQRPQADTPRSAAASRSPCGTSRSAARATSSGPNRAATSRLSASSFTANCSNKASAPLKGEKTAPRVEVQMRLDFLSFGIGDPAGSRSAAARRSEPPPAPSVSVPRETATYTMEEDSSAAASLKAKREVARASACIP
jgi:transcription-repair coupling factor (superfamily II helicase)